MIDPAIRDHVVTWLRQIEAEAGVRVLYAAESGSRAWGFASPDSDYDVRFIYAHPRDWYVTLNEARDVIERPLDAQLVDLAGWDVRKALRLLLKSNPALYEWLASPIAYLDDGRFRAAAEPLFARHASAVALAHHYHSIARGQWRSEIEGNDAVKLKKYFYVVRPLLSLQWVADFGSVPPMNMAELMQRSPMPGDVRRTIDELLRLKRETPELGRGSRNATIDAWALERLEALRPDRLELAPCEQTRSAADADQLFRDTVGF